MASKQPAGKGAAASAPASTAAPAAAPVGSNAAKNRQQFDRAKLTQLCQTEATSLRDYATYLDSFKSQVADQVNSEDRLQEIYQETVPASEAATRKGTVREYLIGNDLKTAGKRRVYELEGAAVKIQRAFRAHRTRKRWLQLVSRMVKVGGAADSQTRLVPATLFDSYARSRHLTTSGKGSVAAIVNARSVTMEERLVTYRRSHVLLHGDELTSW